MNVPARQVWSVPRAAAGGAGTARLAAASYSVSGGRECVCSAEPVGASGRGRPRGGARVYRRRRGCRGRAARADADFHRDADPHSHVGAHAADFDRDSDSRAGDSRGYPDSNRGANGHGCSDSDRDPHGNAASRGYPDSKRDAHGLAGSDSKRDTSGDTRTHA